MKEALSNVLVSFYPMAGRLILAHKDNNEEEKRIDINCNGEGVLFVEAQSDDTFIDDFGDFVPNLEMKKLIPSVDTCCDISSFPLVVFQVTRFKCGGVSLGCGIFHTLSDGLSSIHFINTWSKIARGLSVSVPPFIDRSLLRARDPPTPAFKHVEYHPPPTLNNVHDSAMTMFKNTSDQLTLLKTRSEHKGTLNNVHDQVKVPKSSTTAMFKITSDQLTLLRTRSEHEGSTYEVLAAHIWQCTCKARALDDDQLTKLHVATDGRTRLFPPLPQGYLGNVVFTATPMAKSGELQSETLTKTTRRIHNVLARMNDEYLRSAIDYLELMTDLSKLIRGPTYFARRILLVLILISTVGLGCLFMIQILDGETQFIWDLLVFCMKGLYILPSPNGDKNLRLAVCLDVDHMPLFEKYLYEF